MQDAHNDNLVTRLTRPAGTLLIAAMLVSTDWTPPALSAPPAQPAAETIVRLHASAVVTGDQVTFGDVAELTGDAATLVAGWSIAAAPRLGSAGTIDSRHIQDVLSRRGINLSNWVFRGASRCVITRPLVSRQPKPTVATATAINTNLEIQPAVPTTRPGESTELTDDNELVTPGTLEAAIRNHLRSPLTKVGGKLMVRFSPAVARLLTLAAPNYEFRIVNRSERPLGVVSLEVTIIEKGQSAQVVQVICDVSLRKTVLVAGRIINRGEVLQPADFHSEERTFDRLEEIGMTDASPLAGQRTRRLLHLGEGVSPRDIEPVPMVNRNDLVTVSVRRGGLLITAAARAMSSGCYGETVTLRSESSKDTFVGVVTGPKAVDLTEAKPSTGLAMVGGNR